MRRGLRIGARVVMLGLVAAWVALPSSARAQDAEPAPTPVTLRAEVGGEAGPMITQAANALSAAAANTSVDIQLTSSGDSRRAFINGEADLIVSGVPFSDAEKAALKKGGRDVIEAPVQAVGLQIFGYVPPISTYPQQCVTDDTCVPTQNIPYTGPIRFSPISIGRILYGLENIWVTPEFQADIRDQYPADRIVIAPIQEPRALVRNDPDSFNYYLDDYLGRTIPEYRAAALKALPNAVPGAPTPGAAEIWPNTFTPSRLTMANVVSQIREGLDPASSQAAPGGAITAAGTYATDESFQLNAAKPKETQVPLFRVQLQNAAGQWLYPTPENITTAIAASKGAPLTGAVGTPVPGAYPVTWVNKMYVPSTGLTAEQASAAASAIRWQVTAGRGVAPSLFDGQITSEMTAQALDAANRIVESNCAAAKGTVYTSTDGAPYVPAGSLGAKGSYKLCRSSGTAAAATDTGAAADAGASSDSSGDFSSSSDVPLDSSGLSDLPADPGASVSGVSDVSTGAAGAAGGAKGAGSTQTVAATRNMPLPIPGLTLSPLDRAVTLAIGAGIFLILRTVYERRKASA